MEESNMKGCLGLFLCIVLGIVFLCNADLCKKDEYAIKDSSANKIVINRTTDMVTVYYSNDELHFNMDKTIVKVDSTERVILIDKTTFKF